MNECGALVDVLIEKPVPLPHCPQQISHGLTWNRIRASVVRGCQLTAWGMAWPPRTEVLIIQECGIYGYHCAFRLPNNQLLRYLLHVQLIMRWQSWEQGRLAASTTGQSQETGWHWYRVYRLWVVTTVVFISVVLGVAEWLNRQS